MLNRALLLELGGEPLSDTILKLDNITKIYGNGVVANKNVSIDLKKGEIHSIVGENGAGKSTLMKIIFGIENASSGTMTYKGKEVHFTSSMEAINAGIGMVHQHFMLIPSFTVVQSIILGKEPVKNGIFIDIKRAISETKELAKKYNFDIDVTKKIADLSVGEKQKVEILKTLYRNAEVIILDEPTSVLTPQETVNLFNELRKFKDLGHTIVFISHKLTEVKQISDRITIMRNGQSRGTYNNEDISLEQMTDLIIDRDLITDYDHLREDYHDKTTVLKVENLEVKRKTRYLLEDVSFALKKGEILGVAGVQGNGQAELVRCITGLMNQTGGKVTLADQDISKDTIKNRRRKGLAYIPEDRMEDGVAIGASVSDNIISTYYDRKDINSKFFMLGKKITAEADRLIKTFSIKTQSSKTKIGSLSGGNIQKVVVAREYNTAPVCMVAEQPTHGIDIGSAEFIHTQLIDMRNKGAGILLISADLSEVMNLSDRIIVFYEGEIVGYFKDVKDVTENELGLYMLGVKHQTKEEIGGALND